MCVAIQLLCSCCYNEFLTSQLTEHYAVLIMKSYMCNTIKVQSNTAHCYIFVHVHVTMIDRLLYLYHGCWNHFPSRSFLVAAFVHGAPNNAFCRLERGEIVLSEVCY